MPAKQRAASAVDAGSELAAEEAAAGEARGGPMIALTPAMVEAMLSAPDLELAMGSTAADMVTGGWVYQEAMAAIAVAFGERLRREAERQRRIEDVLGAYDLSPEYLTLLRGILGSMVRDA